MNGEVSVVWCDGICTTMQKNVLRAGDLIVVYIHVMKITRDGTRHNCSAQSSTRYHSRYISYTADTALEAAI